MSEVSPHANSPRRTLNRWSALLLLLVCVPIAYLGWHVISSAREAAARDVSRANLKRIGLALHAYHERYEQFPPAFVMGPDGKPWHSWRVLLLPFLDEQPLYDQYRFDEPWNGEHNRKLMLQRPTVYASRLQISSTKNATTYLGVVSRRSMWPRQFSVKITDVSDGTSNTIHLVENMHSDVVWSEPREMTEKDVLSQLRLKGQEPSGNPKQVIPILLVDGAVRMVSPQINRDTFISLLTPRYARYMVADGWPHEDRPESKLPDVVDISHYPETRVLPVAEMHLEVDQTALYCATSQLAWDQLRPAPGVPVDCERSDVTTVLNAHPFPRDGLAVDAYFVGKSGLGTGSASQMFKQFRKQFPNAPVEMLQGDDLDPGIRILTYLQKSLPFPDVMERFPLPLEFGVLAQTNVRSFGWPSSGGEGGGNPVLKETVVVLDFVSPDDLIVLLKTDTAEHDEIILAKVTPGKTLQATWDAVQTRRRVPAAKEVVQHLRSVDHLQIPIISFGLVATLTELINLKVDIQKHPERFIAAARQTMRFRMDEYGAELIADTQMIVGENGDGALHIDPLKPRHLIFNRPFLIAIQQKNATVPYFLAWIGNADLLERQP